MHTLHFGSSFTIAGSLESRAWIYISQNVPLGMMYCDRGFGFRCHCTLYNIVIGRSTLILLSWALLLQGCVRPPGWFFCSSKGCGGILCCNCTRILGWCCDTLGVQPLSCISIMKGLVERTLECRLKAIGRYLETCAWRVCCTDCFDSWAITWHNRKWLTHGYGQLEELKLFHVVLCCLNFNRCCRIYDNLCTMRVDPHHTLKHLGKGVDLFHDEGFLSDLDGREYRGCESSRLQREWNGISRVATCSCWVFAV